MGFSDRAGMDELWRRAVMEAKIDDDHEALGRMRNLSAEQIMAIPALKVGYLSTVAYNAAGWLQSSVGRRFRISAITRSRWPLYEPLSLHRRGSAWRQRPRGKHFPTQCPTARCPRSIQASRYRNLRARGVRKTARLVCTVRPPDTD